MIFSLISGKTEYTLPISTDDLYQYVGCDAKCVDTSGYEMVWENLNFEELQKINAVSVLYQFSNTYGVDEYIYVNLYHKNISDTMLEIANVIMCEDEIEFYAYDYDDYNSVLAVSNAAKFGMTVANNNGLTKQLRELEIEDYFNYEDYGDSLCYGCELFCDGYFADTRSNINLNTYSWIDIFEEAKGFGYPLSIINTTFDEVFA